MRLEKLQGDFCKVQLRPETYAPTNTFQFGDGLRWTLKPEPGSLEDVHPGIIKKLMRVREQLYRSRKRRDWTKDTVAELSKATISEVRIIESQLSDQRFQYLTQQFTTFIEKMIKGFDRNFDPENIVSRIGSTLWELTVACLFSGERIVFLKNLSSFWEWRSSFEQPPNREIDLMILKNGRWRWIEIKDWQVEMPLRSDYQDALVAQGQAQRKLRDELKSKGVEVDLILLLKFGVPASVHDEILARSGFDDVLYVFPRGFQDAQPKN